MGKHKFTVLLTHDVDAVEKTIQIRLKALVFYLYLSLKHLDATYFFKAFCFFLRSADYWQFEKITALEERHGFKSTFYFYVKLPRKGLFSRLRSFIFDPSYDIQKNERLQEIIKKLIASGYQIGLHGSYDSCNSLELLRQEKKVLEEITDLKITHIRQHWLRLSPQTWELQEKAGFENDSSFGFNDRLGFRDGRIIPFNPNNSKFTVTPMVIMDSTLFDYMMLLEDAAVKEAIKTLDEVKRVEGHCSIIWHQRVFSEDYGWGGTYERVLEWLRSNQG